MPNLTLIRALCQLYKYNEHLNDNCYIDNIFNQINDIPINVLEIYINIIIGFYLLNYEDNNVLANKMLDIIIAKAKYSLKFSHKCFWNLLSCKYTYKKLTDLSCIIHLMGVLMNEWIYQPKYNYYIYN